MLNQLFGIQLSNEAQAAIIGAVVGGGMTLGVPLVEYIVSIKKRRDDRKAFLSSIQTELAALWQMYKGLIGYKFEAYIDNKDRDVYFSEGLFESTRPTFSYYDNNTNKLELVHDYLISAHIIKSYIYLKSLYEYWIYYKTHLDKNLIAECTLLTNELMIQHSIADQTIDETMSLINKALGQKETPSIIDFIVAYVKSWKRGY